MASETSHLDVSSLFGVKGLVAVITGGGSGIGRYMARALDANGAAKVFIIGRREDALKKTAASCPNGSVIPIVGDVSIKDSIRACVDRVAKEVDHIDVLVANSGVAGPTAEPPPTEDKTPHTLAALQEHCWNVPMEDFNRTSEVNVTGVFYTAMGFLPLLDAANKLRPPPSTMPRPQIIATGSIGGFNRIPLAGWAYGASKAGVHHMVKQLSTALAPFNIRVNCICPGLYSSEMTESLFDWMSLKEPRAEGSIEPERVPATRAGGEEDMAGVILWLCSKAGAYTNGNIVVTDGGRLSVHPATY